MIAPQGLQRRHAIGESFARGLDADHELLRRGAAPREARRQPQVAPIRGALSVLAGVGPIESTLMSASACEAQVGAARRRH